VANVENPEVEDCRNDQIDDEDPEENQIDEIENHLEDNTNQVEGNDQGIENPWVSIRTVRSKIVKN
jgi:hypothetical protein